MRLARHPRLPRQGRDRRSLYHQLAVQTNRLLDRKSQARHPQHLEGHAKRRRRRRQDRIAPCSQSSAPPAPPPGRRSSRRRRNIHAWPQSPPSYFWKPCSPKQSCQEFAYSTSYNHCDVDGSIYLVCVRNDTCDQQHFRHGGATQGRGRERRCPSEH